MIGVFRFSNVFSTASARSPPEVKGAGQHPDVVEVLHPAVQDAELYHGMELFGDGALHGVAVNSRRGKVKKRRIATLPGPDHIPESDIDLQRDPRVARPPRTRTRTPSYSASSVILAAVTVSASKDMPSGSTIDSADIFHGERQSHRDCCRFSPEDRCPSWDVIRVRSTPKTSRPP